MRIFIIARGFPSPQEPTWGCFEKDQAEALVRMGHDVTILSVDTRFRFYWRPLGITRKIKNGIKIYDFFLLPYALLFILPRFMKERFFAFLYYIVYQHAVNKEGIPDILYAHYLQYMRYALYIRNKGNIPLVGIEHWSEMGYNQIKPHILKVAQNTYPHIDSLITVSSSLRENILNHTSLNSAYIVNNIVGKEFNFIPKRQDDTLSIITTGSLIHRKGFDLLIEALSQINPILSPNWKLRIVGKGELKNALQNLINAKNLQEHIYLVGSKNKLEIVEILQNSDLFVLPSRSETFGVVYIEAMACGLPIIATDCGGPRDIVTPKNGLLIPNEDTSALADAILYMVKNINKYDRKAIAEDCQARFSSEVIAKQLTQIFEDTIKKHKEKQ
mgnify:CR=1 FL=1|jgi:glycosyltransferase involved in cell wall biosynthesis